MSVNTFNTYGKISISDDSIAKVAYYAATESYGVVEMVSLGFFESIVGIFNKEKNSRGVKIKTSGDRIYISINVIIKYGVSISAVAESLKEAIKYKAEKFTGMIVDSVDVNIVGVKL